MKKHIYVIGHRNPDTDSVASAIAYAELKRMQGEERVTAAMAGSLNPQTAYVLNRLGIEAPLYLADVHPKVRDVVRRAPVTVRETEPLANALALFHKNGIRVLPVLSESGTMAGVVSLLKLSERSLLAGHDNLRLITASLLSLAQCLEGTFLTGEPSSLSETLYLFVGAMAEHSFSARIEGFHPEKLMVVTGDRRSIQTCAIERGVRLLVVTGGLPVEPDVVQLAREKGVTIISTRFDTAAAASLARLATPVGHLVETGFESIGIGESRERLQEKLRHASAVMALDDDGFLAGVATKSSLMAPLPYGLILVDHNELGQSVPGAEEVEIVEVVDHHKLGNPPTTAPIPFITAPVGSTCTLVAHLFRDAGLAPSANIAALLLAGVLSDTVILKSPTTTERDHIAVQWLSGLACLDYGSFGAELFAASGALSRYGGPERIVGADFKRFSHGDISFGVGQVEVFGFSEYHSMKEELKGALAEIREKEGLQMAGLMVTDIGTESTLFVMEGGQALSRLMGYPQLEPHVFEMKGVMSRKKQLVPHLLKVLGAR